MMTEWRGDASALCCAEIWESESDAIHTQDRAALWQALPLAATAFS